MAQELNRTLFSRFLAECVGTFFLVLFGPGAAIVFADAGVLGHVMIAVVFGVVVAGVCTLIGPISGGHINPAMTLAAALHREIAWLEALWYVGMQMVGAVLAGFVLKVAFAGNMSAAQTRLANGVSEPAGMVLEMCMTAAMILAVIQAPGKWKPWAAGLVVCLDALVGGPVTGASMNPARTLGPNIASDGIGSPPLVHMAGPLLGAVVAVLIAKVWETARVKRG